MVQYVGEALLTNVLLIDNFIKQYQAAFIMYFIMLQKVNHLELINYDNLTTL